MSRTEVCSKCRWLEPGLSPAAPTCFLDPTPVVVHNPDERWCSHWERSREGGNEIIERFRKEHPEVEVVVDV